MQEGINEAKKKKYRGIAEVSQIMACVYRYTDTCDAKIKYVGIVYGGEYALHKRVLQHRKCDKWAVGEEWLIEYFYRDDLSRTDTEYLESHFIALYETYKWYNKAKSDWGISRFIDDASIEWKVYCGNTLDGTPRHSVPSAIQVCEDLLLDDKFQSLKQSSRMLLLCMFMESRGQNEFCFPKSVAAEYGFCNDTLRRSIDELVKNDYLKKVESGKNTRTPNKYSLVESPLIYAVSQKK